MPAMPKEEEEEEHAPAAAAAAAPCDPARWGAVPVGRLSARDLRRFAADPAPARPRPRPPRPAPRSAALGPPEAPAAAPARPSRKPRVTAPPSRPRRSGRGPDAACLALGVVRGVYGLYTRSPGRLLALAGPPGRDAGTARRGKRRRTGRWGCAGGGDDDDGGAEDPDEDAGGKLQRFFGGGPADISFSRARGGGGGGGKRARAAMAVDPSSGCTLPPLASLLPAAGHRPPFPRFANARASSPDGDDDDDVVSVACTESDFGVPSVPVERQRLIQMEFAAASHTLPSSTIPSWLPPDYAARLQGPALESSAALLVGGEMVIDWERIKEDIFVVTGGRGLSERKEDAGKIGGVVWKG
ncbi:MAG: hypothetical protein BJ554DRAFT_5539 [Olpidium bornovanus]|uniref:Uncharacterized protein n=1 Tax=Olpidium bornovanus TaxID=278681 RepID=A0A8H7ZZG2_9FUNG|nr:MAG: hypothetical protein BJ554DRAFT_5539 [Olpidium bornovanus]